MNVFFSHFFLLVKQLLWSMRFHCLLFYQGNLGSWNLLKVLVFVTSVYSYLHPGDSWPYITQSGQMDNHVSTIMLGGKSRESLTFSRHPSRLVLILEPKAANNWTRFQSWLLCLWSDREPVLNIYSTLTLSIKSNIFYMSNHFKMGQSPNTRNLIVDRRPRYPLDLEMVLGPSHGL